MNTRATIRKILIALLWVGIGSGMLTLLIAAMDKKNREQCSSYTISIKNGLETISYSCQNDSVTCAFVDEKDIRQLLVAALGSDPAGRKISEINLRQLEELLESKEWIRDAEMWFDNRNILRISVIERSPLARIFTTTGLSFYIDSTGFRLPVSEKITVRLPVFTGFPVNKMMSAKDSMLMQQVKMMADFILHDSFWMSQVAQIDINPDGNFELVPVVGNHVIKFGTADDLQKKFNRLMIFYKEVLSKTGFDAYRTIDVQYDGQVVATKRESEKKSVDLVRYRTNVEALIKQVQLMQKDTSAASLPEQEKKKVNESADATIKSALQDPHPPPARPNTVKAESLPEKNENKPKAVMPKKINN